LSQWWAGCQGAREINQLLERDILDDLSFYINLTFFCTFMFKTIIYLNKNNVFIIQTQWCFTIIYIRGIQTFSSHGSFMFSQYFDGSQISNDKKNNGIIL